VLLGLLAPTAGELSVFAAPWQREALSRIGASLDGPSLYGHLSARADLRVHSHPLGRWEDPVARALAAARLEGTGRQEVCRSSTGMRRRLASAVGLLGEPDLLALDEPQDGLDPEGTSSWQCTTTDLVAGGRTVALSSHRLGEVAPVSDDVGVMAEGRQLFGGPLATTAPDGSLERPPGSPRGAGDDHGRLLPRPGLRGRAVAPLGRHPAAAPGRGPRAAPARPRPRDGAQSLWTAVLAHQDPWAVFAGPLAVVLLVGTVSHADRAAGAEGR